MGYNGTVINDSPTITRKAGTAITDGAFKAVSISSGKIVVANGAGMQTGILIAETDSAITTGDDLTVQVKDIGVWKSGSTFIEGDPLTSDATGLAVKATAGKFILAVALEDSTGAGQAVQVQIIKAGYYPAA